MGPQGREIWIRERSETGDHADHLKQAAGEGTAAWYQRPAFRIGLGDFRGPPRSGFYQLEGDGRWPSIDCRQRGRRVSGVSRRGARERFVDASADFRNTL